MNGAFEIGGAGLETQQKALDIIANNIANLNTAGFKRSDVRFSEMVAQVSDLDNPPADLSNSEPSLAGVNAHAALMLDQQGELEHTGSPLDLAISGDGFIELLGPQGQSLLWRGGPLSVGDDGQLTANGVPLTAQINVPTGATNLTIGSDGKVSALVGDSDTPTQLGQISLVRVSDASAVERLDNGLYRLTDDNRPSEVTPGQDGAGLIVQGSVERSNVQIADEMVRLMMVQRAFSANAQVLQAADQLMGLVDNLRR